MSTDIIPIEILYLILSKIDRIEGGPDAALSIVGLDINSIDVWKTLVFYKYPKIYPQLIKLFDEIAPIWEWTDIFVWGIIGDASAALVLLNMFPEYVEEFVKVFKTYKLGNYQDYIKWFEKEVILLKYDGAKTYKTHIERKYVYPETIEYQNDKVAFMFDLISGRTVIADKLPRPVNDDDWNERRSFFNILLPYLVERGSDFMKHLSYELLLEYARAVANFEIIPPSRGVILRIYPSVILELYKRNPSGALQDIKR